jgi:hypothetical protein
MWYCATSLNSSHYEYYISKKEDVYHMFKLPHNIRISAVHELMRRLLTRSR